MEAAGFSYLRTILYFLKGKYMVTIDNEKTHGCLTKADLADDIYETLSVDKNKASQIVEDWIELIKIGLEKDNKVMLSGFGVFEVKSKKARLGRNPQTKERITLAARKVVKFKPSQLLRDQLNK